MTRLRLRVTPGARKNAILGYRGDALKVAVAAPPERGRANDAVVALLAGALDIPESAIEIVSGETSQDKTVAVDLPEDEIRRRLT